MIAHREVSDSELRKKLRQKKVTVGGNKTLKIYGTLHCRSGKRMKRENRVFFSSEEEAEANGYRPCGHCMKENYQHWKNTHGPV